MTGNTPLHQLLATAAVLMLTLTPAADAKEKKIVFDREAKLFRLPDGDAFIARYHYQRKGKGVVQIDLSARQVLTGEYLPVKNGDSRWGLLFRSVGGASAAAVNTKALQRGIIVAEGGGMNIQCEYVTTASRQGGFGFCKDSTDALYRLMF